MRVQFLHQYLPNMRLLFVHSIGMYVIHFVWNPFSMWPFFDRMLRRFDYHIFIILILSICNICWQSLVFVTNFVKAAQAKLIDSLSSPKRPNDRPTERTNDLARIRWFLLYICAKSPPQNKQPSKQTAFRCSCVILPFFTIMDTIWYHPNVKYVNNNSELLLASKKNYTLCMWGWMLPLYFLDFHSIPFHPIPIRALMRWNASIYYLWLLFVLNVW